MRNFNLQVRCTICATAEVITAGDYDKNVRELMNDAYQADSTKINPYFKLPYRVLSGGKGETNWKHVPLCKTCRDQWTNSVLPDMAQSLNTFTSGGD